MPFRPIRMTFEEFERLPRPPGWKHEYFGGNAYIQPRHSVAIVRLETAYRPVSVPEGFQIRPATPEDAPRLVPAFFDAFRQSVDYWGYRQAAIRQSAADSIRTCFAGQRGAFHPTSFLAVAPMGRSVAGAALLVEDGEGPNLDLLFVRPRWQRQGLANALVQTALTDLHTQGEPHLDSAYVVANAVSAAWHQKFGFIELPDLARAKEQYYDILHEVRRRELIGELTDAERQAMERGAEQWRQRIEELEALADQDGYEAVSPLLRRRRERKRKQDDVQE